MSNELEKPFPVDAVKYRPGAGGKRLAYVEVQEYIRRLNDCFGANWSYEIVSRERQGDEVFVHARLTADGVVKDGIGGSSVRRDRAGAELSLGDAYKAASSDALKRCARLLGVGLQLYAPDTEGQVRQSADANGGRVTNAQLAKLRELAGQLGLDWRSFRARVRDERGANPEYLDRSAASELIGRLIEYIKTHRSNGNGDGEVARW